MYGLYLKLFVSLFAETINNGWVYEARAETDDGCFCFPGFLDQEEALAAAMAEFPDIKYREEDFAAITTYTLRKKRS